MNEWFKDIESAFDLKVGMFSFSELMLCCTTQSMSQKTLLRKKKLRLTGGHEKKN